jgi:hypothetical protein
MVVAFVPAGDASADGDRVDYPATLIEGHTGMMKPVHRSERPPTLGPANRELVQPSPAAGLALAPLGICRRDPGELHRAA